MDVSFPMTSSLFSSCTFDETVWMFDQPTKASSSRRALARSDKRAALPDLGLRRFERTIRPIQALRGLS